MTTKDRYSSDMKADQRFTWQGRQLMRDEYLGKSGLGPLGDQWINCPRCEKAIHKFSIRCHECGTEIREIGKIESGPRGSAARGIGFVMGILVLAMAAMVLADRGRAGGYTLASAVVMAASAFVLGVNGLLGLLYFRFFAVVMFMRGLLGFALGAISLLLAIVLLILLI